MGCSWGIAVDCNSFKCLACQLVGSAAASLQDCSRTGWLTVKAVDVDYTKEKSTEKLSHAIHDSREMVDRLEFVHDFEIGLLVLNRTAPMRLFVVLLSSIAIGDSVWAQVPDSAQSAGASESPAVSYDISFQDAQAHYIQVEMQLSHVIAGPVELFMPVWTPGSYLVREYARHVDSIQAFDGADIELAIAKTAKNRWVIQLEKDSSLRVRYRVYCNELSVRTNFVDSDFGILNGAATFLTCEPFLEAPHRVKLRLRGGWSQAVTSLGKPDDAPAHTYHARDYDELVDAPILVGNPTIHPFQVGGATHYLVNQGGDALWDGEKAAADAAKIVAEHQQMWGSVPYEQYFFLNLIAEGGGGLEHDNSTVLLTSRWSFRSKRSYVRWLGLVSHEFFHTWNIRRLRPQALIDYDYTHENYFDELWVAEGVTSYYDELALVRAGLISSREYLAALSKQITTLQTTPGRLTQSLADSSYDTWIKFYRPNENSRNTTISYYNKGAIAAFLLDIEIRRATENQKSLDDVMRTLWAEHSGDRGYTNDDVLRIASQVADQDLSEWFERVIQSPAELDFDPALDWLGLRFRPDSSGASANVSNATVPKSTVSKATNAKSGGTETSAAKQQNANAEDASASPSGSTKQKTPDAGNSNRGTPWIGVSTTSDNGRLTVSGITEGSPAYSAGINVDDELIALNGYRLSSSLTDRLRQYQVGESIELITARRGKLRDVVLQLVTKPQSSWTLEVLRRPSELQKQSMQQWLHIPEPSESDAEE